MYQHNHCLPVEGHWCYLICPLNSRFRLGFLAFNCSCSTITLCACLWHHMCFVYVLFHLVFVLFEEVIEMGDLMIYLMGFDRHLLKLFAQSGIEIVLRGCICQRQMSCCALWCTKFMSNSSLNYRLLPDGGLQSLIWFQRESTEWNFDHVGSHSPGPYAENDTLKHSSVWHRAAFIPQMVMETFSIWDRVESRHLKTSDTKHSHHCSTVFACQYGTMHVPCQDPRMELSGTAEVWAELWAGKIIARLFLGMWSSSVHKLSYGGRMA